MDSKRGIRLRIFGAITSHPTHPKPTSPKLRIASPFLFWHFSYKLLNAHNASSRLHHDDAYPGFPSHNNCVAVVASSSFSSSEQRAENFSKKCLNPFSVILLFRKSTATTFFKATISSNRRTNMASVTSQFEADFVSLLLKYSTEFLSIASSIRPIAASENVPPEQFTSVKTHELPTSWQNLRIASMVLSVNRLLFRKFNALNRFNDEEDDNKSLSTNASSTSQLDAFNLSKRAFLVFLKSSTSNAHPLSLSNALSFPLMFISRRCSKMFDSSSFASLEKRLSKNNELSFSSSSHLTLETFSARHAFDEGV